MSVFHLFIYFRFWSTCSRNAYRGLLDDGIACIGIKKYAGTYEFPFWTLIPAIKSYGFPWNATIYFIAALCNGAVLAAEMV
jgi:hypothetical protein